MCVCLFFIGALRIFLLTSFWLATFVTLRGLMNASLSELTRGPIYGVPLVNPACLHTDGIALAGCRGGHARGTPHGPPSAIYCFLSESSIVDWAAAPIAMPLILLFF